MIHGERYNGLVPPREAKARQNQELQATQTSGTTDRSNTGFHREMNS